MNARLRRHLIVTLVVLAVGAAGGELYFRYLVRIGAGEEVPLARELKTVPLQLGDWNGQDNPIAPDVLMKIGAMDTLRRSYTTHRTGGVVALDLYIAYFGGIRGVAPHNPEVCMPGAGWDILGRETVAVRMAGFPDAFDVHRDVFENRSSQMKRLVVWWEYVHGENVASHYMQRLKWVLPNFLGGNRGSILQVQIAVNFIGDNEEQMALVEDFMARLGPHLEQVLPRAVSATTAAK